MKRVFFELPGNLIRFLIHSSFAPQFLVLILLILLIASISTPAILRQREEARRQQSHQNLQQIGMGLSNYHDTFQSFPSSPDNSTSTPQGITTTKDLEPPPNSKLISPL